jgi:arsenite/tail-anchored protein-transporting ATPase
MSFEYEKIPAEQLLPRDGKCRRIFFAGKGGVGKTTMACASAVYTANQGFKTLLMTTDPAAHIGNLFDRTVTSVPEQIDGMYLWVARIDPKAAFEAYRNKVLSSLKTQFESTVLRVREELNSPCTEEVAVFQEFLDYLLSDNFEVIVFDTAPTGHTLRLLQLSFSYEAELEHKEAFTAETAALDRAQLSRMNEAIRILQSPDETGMFFVTLPETTPIAEMERTIADLAKSGIDTQVIIVNQVLPQEASTSRLFGKRLEKQMAHVKALKQRNGNSAISVVALQDGEIIGVDSLKLFVSEVVEIR